MKKIHILIFLFFLCSCKKVNFYSYEQLHQTGTTVAIRELNLNRKIHSYSSPNSYMSEFGDYNMVYLFDSIDIRHYYPSYEARSMLPVACLDTIEIEGSKFCIQNLLIDEEFGLPEIQHAYLFNEKQKKYLLLTGNDIYDRGIGHLYWVLLFDITDKKNVVSIVPVAQARCNKVYASHPSFIGDFNKDGKVDICLFCENVTFDNFVKNNIHEDIYVYNIENDSLVKVPRYKLIIDQNNKNRIYYIGSNKWFYPLNGSNTRPKEFEFIFPQDTNYKD